MITDGASGLHCYLITDPAELDDLREYPNTAVYKVTERHCSSPASNVSAAAS